ncbi:BamA/OMP85 family outer membrane protein [Chitinophaga nivalis]|uniref:Outer membrane protein assembly factor n=1 Tax=Chitinophaga nivalis TaxID=2991709 RepID=A0ABT3IW26_9BACT|nr:POTRA domain-containing protein [Chitinophaga nivalis]MCW3462116.1 outer membrane protein assembly factor [Chitinophaga nivalis]MCW3488192.1 outer membrane protein assembly factor [Chitinophaga nivalis]
MKKLFPKGLLAIALCCSAGIRVSAQQKDTLPPAPPANPPAASPVFTGTPQQYEIAEITVAGTQYLDKSLLLSLSGLSVGDKVTYPGGDQFTKAIQSLWSQRLFADVTIYVTKIEDNKIWLEIGLLEMPRIASFTFRGIKKSEADDISTKAGLRKGSVVTQSLKQNLIGVVHKFYADKGYGNATIKIEERKDTSQVNATNLVFNVNKGNKVRIENIHIVGNYNILDAKLKKRMKGTKERTRLTLHPDNQHVYVDSLAQPDDFWQTYGFLQPTRALEQLDPYFRFKLFSSAKFNEGKYIEDKGKVIGYYNSKGYRDAVITRDTTYKSLNKNLNIDMQISEGKKYYFGDITWKGNTRYSDSVLTRLLGIKRGDVYNLELLEKRLGKQMSPEGGDISGYYMDYGYLFFQIDPVEIGIRGDTIDYEIRLREGPQATIKEVRIAGNEKTNEHVIRRELRTIPGEKFSRQDLIRSNREIANLGFFNPEKIGMNPVPNVADGTVDIDYTVEEKANDQLELSAGWGGYIGLTGTLGVTFNNFSLRNIFRKETWDPLPSGDGQKLSVRVSSNGKAYRSYNFSFTEPWLGGKKRNQFSVSFYSSYQNPYAYQNYYRPYDTSSSSNGHFKVLGASVSLGKQLKWPDDYFTLIYSVNYQQYKLKNYNYFGITGFDNGTSNNINLKLTLSRSSVDQQIFPRSGSNFMFSAQYTPPYSLFSPNKDYSKESVSDQFKFIEYQKYRFNAEWYVPLSRPMGSDNKTFVLKVAAKFGYIGRYNNRTRLSPFGRFELGGDGLSNFAIYDRDIISQRGYPVYYTSDPSYNPESGQPQGYEGFTVFNKYVMELRYPFSLNPSSTIFGLAFVEAANGYRDMKDFNPFNLRRSAGIGMRFYLPMFGLLGFDYGIGFDRLKAGGGLKDAAKFTFMLGFEPE